MDKPKTNSQRWDELIRSGELHTMPASEKAMDKPGLATIDCVVAFGRWYGMPVAEDMDITTEIAWRNWQAAWNAAMSEAAKMEASDPIRKAALRIADESSLTLIMGESLPVDHVTRRLDADDLAGGDLLAEAVEYLEARGLVTRMDTSDEVLLILGNEE